MKTSDPDAIPAPPTPGRTRWLSHRRLLIGATAAAALAITFSLVQLSPPDDPGGRAPAPPSRPPGNLALTALEIVTDDDYVEITINDPVADPERYSAELAEYGFDIQLSLAPTGPEWVGRVVFMESGEGPAPEVIEAPGDCTANGNCSVAIRVPVTFSSYANIVFGRTPLPGETGEGDVPILTQEEEQAVAELVGMRVSDARAVLAELGWTAEYRVGAESREATADEISGDWYVTDAAPLGGGVVVLWAAPS